MTFGPRRLIALQSVALKGNMELVQLLLTAGADVDSPPSYYHKLLSRLILAGKMRQDITINTMMKGYNFDSDI
jgi:hypothetical protein